MMCEAFQIPVGEPYCSLEKSVQKLRTSAVKANQIIGQITPFQKKKTQKKKNK